MESQAEYDDERHGEGRPGNRCNDSACNPMDKADRNAEQERRSQRSDGPLAGGDHVQPVRVMVVIGQRSYRIPVTEPLAPRHDRG